MKVVAKAKVYSMGCIDKVSDPMEAPLDPIAGDETGPGNDGPGEGDNADECDPPDSVGAPVRLSNGNVRYTERDPIAAGLPMLTLRTYDSRKDDSGVFGRGWSSIWDGQIWVHALSGGNERVTVVTERNDAAVFSGNAVDGYEQVWPNGRGVEGQLTRDGVEYVLREHGQQLERRFVADPGTGVGHLVAITDLASVRRFDVAAAAVTDSWGSTSWAIQTDPVTSRVTQIQSGAHTIAYTYSGAHLTQVTIDGALWRQYSYDTVGNLLEVRDVLDNVIEQHTYVDGADPDFPYWGASLSTANERLDIEYGLTDGLPRALAGGERAVRTTNFQGAETYYFLRHVAPLLWVGRRDGSTTSTWMPTGRTSRHLSAERARMRVGARRAGASPTTALGTWSRPR